MLYELIRKYTSYMNFERKKKINRKSNSKKELEINSKEDILEFLQAKTEENP